MVGSRRLRGPPGGAVTQRANVYRTPARPSAPAPAPWPTWLPRLAKLVVLVGPLLATVATTLLAGAALDRCGGLPGLPDASVTQIVAPPGPPPR